MNNKKILVLLADGFEDTELVSTINVFKRNNVDYDLFSVENKKIVEGQNRTLIEPTIFNELNLEDYDGLFLPGGKGHKILLESKLTIDLVKKYNNDKKLVSAICAAPEVLKKAGILNGITFTSYPSYALLPTNTGEAFEKDQNIITGKDFEASIAFAKKIVQYLKEN